MSFQVRDGDVPRASGSRAWEGFLRQGTVSREGPSAACLLKPSVPAASCTAPLPSAVT